MLPLALWGSCSVCSKIPRQRRAGKAGARLPGSDVHVSAYHVMSEVNASPHNMPSMGQQEKLLCPESSHR